MTGLTEEEFAALLPHFMSSLPGARDNFAYTLLDCPPSLGPLTVNALAAADRVLVPVQAEYYALEGLAQLLHSIELVRSRLNRKLLVAGMILTMVDVRTRLAADVAAEVRKHFGDLVFDVLHTPGHTEGSVCLYEPTGDEDLASDPRALRALLRQFRLALGHLGLQRHDLASVPGEPVPRLRDARTGTLDIGLLIHHGGDLLAQDGHRGREAVGHACRLQIFLGLLEVELHRLVNRRRRLDRDVMAELLERT
jgi:hypothetical protein